MPDSHETIGSVDTALWDELYGYLDKGPHIRISEYLAAGGDPNLRRKSCGWTLLHAAVFKDRKRIVEELIRKGADVNAVRDKDYFTPLAQAAHKAHVGCLRVLLAAGASLDCRPLRMPLIESLQYAQRRSERVRRILLAVRVGVPPDQIHQDCEDVMERARAARRRRGPRPRRLWPDRAPGERGVRRR